MGGGPEPGPRLVVEGAGTVVSVCDDRREALVSGPGATRLLRNASGGLGRDPERLRRLAGLPADGDNARVRWPECGAVLSDAPAAGAGQRALSREALREVAGERSPAHAYVAAAAQVPALLSWLNDAALPLRRPLIPVVAHAGEVLVGPLLEPGRAPCPACYASRVQGNRASLAERVRRGHEILEPDPGTAAALGLARALWEVPCPEQPVDCLLVVDLVRGATHRERVLPLPRCGCGERARVGAPGDLVGRAAGAVAAVGQAARVAGLGAAATVAAGPGGSLGTAVSHDPSDARRRALGEAAETLAARTVPAAAVRSARVDLPRAVPAAALRPYLPEQYAQPGFPYRPPDEDTALLWVPTRDRRGAEGPHVPLELVSLAAAPPLLGPQRSTGQAARLSWRAAEDAALLELVERDVVARSWFEGLAAEVSAEPLLGSLVSRVAAAGLRCRAAVCPSPCAPVAVVGVADSDGRGALGAAAGPTLAGAAQHALEEALQLDALERQAGRGLELEAVWWATSGDPEDSAESWSPPATVECYAPLLADLTTPEVRAAGFRVVGAWSATAVDVPRPGEPLPLARWRPSAAAVERIASAPGLLTGPGGASPTPDAEA